MTTKSWRPLKKSKHHQFSDEDHCRVSTIQLPESLLYEIFILLPVKSLIRFRCVSKGICRLIDSPHFVKIHNTHPCRRERSDGDDYGIILKEVCFGRLRLLSVNFLNLYLNIAKVLELNFTSLPKEGIHVIGCCKGIFCVGNILISQRCVLWNPSNGTSRMVEWSNLFSQIDTAISIGYDYVGDDFKLVCFLGLDGISMEVYSLRKDSWRKFNGNFPPGNIIGSRTGVCVNGAMHWLWTNPTVNYSFIAAFDFVTETFTSLPLPPSPSPITFQPIDYAPYELRDFRGCLSVIIAHRLQSHVRGYTFWVMESYGVTTTWTKLCYRIVAPSFHHYPNRENRLLYFHLGRLTWWDPQDRSNEIIEFPGRISDRPKECEAAYIYERNLFRL